MTKTGTLSRSWPQRHAEDSSSPARPAPCQRCSPRGGCPAGEGISSTQQRLRAGPGQFPAQITGGISPKKAFRRGECRSKSSPGYCAYSRAPGSSRMRSLGGKGIFTLGPFQDFQALSHHEQ